MHDLRQDSKCITSVTVSFAAMLFLQILAVTIFSCFLHPLSLRKRNNDSNTMRNRSLRKPPHIRNRLVSHPAHSFKSQTLHHPILIIVPLSMLKKLLVNHILVSALTRWWWTGPCGSSCFRGQSRRSILIFSWWLLKQVFSYDHTVDRTRYRWAKGILIVGLWQKKQQHTCVQCNSTILSPSFQQCNIYLELEVWTKTQKILLFVFTHLPQTPGDSK